jgi:hypothetical protein
MISGWRRLEGTQVVMENASPLAGFSCTSLRKVVQDINHRLAGNPDQAAKRVIQFQN